MTLRLICSVSLVFLCVGLVSAGSDLFSPAQVVDYLTRYGYLEPPNPRTGRLRTQAELHDAVAKFQKFTGLNQTGQLLDDELLEFMKKPRCGFPDFGPAISVRRKKRYVLQGSKWNTKHLTYAILNYTPHLNYKEVDQTIADAFAMWSNYTQLKFTRVSYPEEGADILIKFGSGTHGDAYPFDGPGGTLAHAFYPHNNAGLSGDVHFDGDELFTLLSNGGINLFWVAVHELGHSLGLEHSSHSDSFMFPYYRGYVPKFSLHDDDIRGIQQIYGKPQIERVTPEPHTNPTEKADTPDKCTSGLDAVIMTADHLTYAFKGDYFWPISDQGAWTSALKTSHFWMKLKGKVDAGFTRMSDGKTFIFQGSNYFVFINRTLKEGPLPISHLNLPKELENMDAAVEWGRNGRLYLFKGDKYWRYNYEDKAIDSGYPQQITGPWGDLPGHFDAAVQWKNGKSYFFKGKKYYSIDDRFIKVEEGYPRDIGTYWMACSAEGLVEGGISPDSSSAYVIMPNIVLFVSTALLSIF